MNEPSPPDFATEPPLDVVFPPWDPDTPIRPVTPVPPDAVMAHFQPWIDLYRARPNVEADRLSTKVNVPFLM